MWQNECLCDVIPGSVFNYWLLCWLFLQSQLFCVFLWYGTVNSFETPLCVGFQLRLGFVFYSLLIQVPSLDLLHPPNLSLFQWQVCFPQICPFLYLFFFHFLSLFLCAFMYSDKAWQFCVCQVSGFGRLVFTGPNESSVFFWQFCCLTLCFLGFLLFHMVQFPACNVPHLPVQFSGSTIFSVVPGL